MIRRTLIVGTAWLLGMAWAAGSGAMICNKTWDPWSGEHCPGCRSGSPWENAWRGGETFCLRCDNPCTAETGIARRPDELLPGCATSPYPESPAAVLGALDLSDQQFEQIAGHAPAIAEALTWMLAVPGGRGAAFDLRFIDGVLNGSPSYQRAWSSRRAPGDQPMPPDLVGDATVHTAVKGCGLPVDGASGQIELTIRSFPIAGSSRHVPGPSRQVVLNLVPTGELFDSSTTEFPAPVYRAISVELMGE